METNNPMTMLKDEHTNIMKVVKAMENLASTAESGGGVRIDLMEQCADFMRTYADKGHHGKEEDVLFHYLYENGFHAATAPIPVLKSEHEEARRLIRTLQSELESLKVSQPQATENVVQLLRAITRLYFAHIGKENFRFFPLTEAVLPDANKEEVWQLFKKVNERLGEEMLRRYESFAEEIEIKIGH